MITPRSQHLLLINTLNNTKGNHLYCVVDKESSFKELFFLLSREKILDKSLYFLYYPEIMGKTRMKFISRPEELVLLAVWRLKENAYCVPIKKQLAQSTGHDWSFGAVYDPLDRLEKKGLLESHLSDPTAKRGGKRKRIYKLTPSGIMALIEIKTITDEVWDGVPLKVLKEEL